MYDNKVANMKLGYDRHIYNMEKQIKEKEKELADKIENLKQKTDEANDREDLCEMLRMANEAVDEKTNEVTEIRMQVEEMSMAVMQRD